MVKELFYRYGRKEIMISTWLHEHKADRCAATACHSTRQHAALHVCRNAPTKRVA